MSKYRNVKVQEGAYVFDSKAEARRYVELKLLQTGQQITDLVVHPDYNAPVQAGGGARMTKYGNRKDSNHAELVEALMMCGAYVEDRAQHYPGAGYDLLVLFHGKVWFLEVKGPKGKLTPNEGLMGQAITDHGGRYAVVRSIDEVLALIGAIA